MVFVDYFGVPMSLSQIFGLTIPDDKVAVTWCNIYSEVVVRTKNFTVVFDPIDVKPSDLVKVDVLLVTHEHYDHFDAELTEEIQKQTNAVVVTTPYVANQLKGISSSNLKPLKVGESVTVGRVTLNAEYSSHPANQPLTFVLTLDNGLKIYHSSDSKPYPEMRSIGEKYKPDLAFCTVGIAPGTSPKSGVEVAKLVKPKVAIPYHTDKPKALEDFSKILGEEAPEIKVKILKRFEVFVYP